MGEASIPDATAARLPRYLQALRRAAQAGAITLSSEQLARASGTTSAKVRKDLSCLGSHGTRGVGYPVTALADELARVLGLIEGRPVVLVGAGNLGRALAAYGGFERGGFRVAAVIDADPQIVGRTIAGHRVRAAEDLPAVLMGTGATLAVLTVPDASAQAVADTLVAAGVTAILSFASLYLDVPEHVRVRRVDLATELQLLSFYEQADEDVPAAAG